MSEKNANQKAMDNVLTEIGEALKLMESHQGDLTPLKELDAVATRAELETYQQLFDIICEFWYDLPRVDHDAPESTDKKQFLLRAKDMEQESLMLQKAFSQALEKSKKQKKSKKGEKEEAIEQQKKERRKLFKTIGGDKKWIPL